MMSQRRISLLRVSSLGLFEFRFYPRGWWAHPGRPDPRSNGSRTALSRLADPSGREGGNAGHSQRFPLPITGQPVARSNRPSLAPLAGVTRIHWLRSQGDARLGPDGSFLAMLRVELRVPDATRSPDYAAFHSDIVPLLLQHG